MKREALEELKKEFNERLFFRDLETLDDRCGNHVNAKAICLPDIIDVSEKPTIIRGRYSCSLNNTAVLLRPSEIKFLLDIDSLTKWGDVEAQLEASQGGPRIANAYLLGGGHYISELPQRKVFPVQYFKIIERRVK